MVIGAPTLACLCAYYTPEFFTNGKNKCPSVRKFNEKSEFPSHWPYTLNVSTVEENTGPGTSFKDRQRLVREELILDEAQALLASKGYSDMTLEDVILRVGISKPTLYQHFRSKDEMVVRVVMRAMRRATEYGATLDPALPACTRIQMFFDWMLECRFGADGLRFGESGVKLAFSCPARTMKEEEESRLTVMLTKLFEDAQREGSARTDLDACFLARSFLTHLRDVTIELAVEQGEVDLATLKQFMTRLYTCPGVYVTND